MLGFYAKYVVEPLILTKRIFFEQHPRMKLQMMATKNQTYQNETNRMGVYDSFVKLC